MLYNIGDRVRHIRSGILGTIVEILYLEDVSPRLPAKPVYIFVADNNPNFRRYCGELDIFLSDK